MSAPTTRTAADIFLEGLDELGISHLFCNLGTDHAPLIEELAGQEARGEARLQTVLCPHENTAVHMAAGYAAISGRGQAVLVHVDAGTANAAMGLHNAFRSRWPVLLIAGRAPFTSRGEMAGGRDNYVHFIQEPYDQASLVRPYVKWEGDLPAGIVGKEVLHRAYSIMMSDPPGPAYLTLRREILAGSCDAGAADGASVAGRLRLGGADPEVVAELAGKLMRAERPLLITTYAGRNPACVDSLARLAEIAGMRVIEANPTYLNIPHDHPCYGGSSANRYLSDADLGLLVDVDVPWIPNDAQPRPDSHWLQVDLDPIKRDLPLWPYRVDQRVAGDSCRILEQVADRIAACADAGFVDRAAARVRQYEAEARSRRAAEQAEAARPGVRGAVSAAYLCAAVARQLDDRAIMLNEAVRSAAVVAAQMPRRQGGTFLGNGGGGLGWSAGAALGAKLAAPDREVVRVVGDGAFYFGNPTSFLATARQYGLPTLTVVLDNSGWAAVKTATVRVYPDGEAVRTGSFQSRLAPDMDFARMARAAGAFGMRVDDPAEAEAAVADALAAVRGGTPAVLHVRIPVL